MSHLILPAPPPATFAAYLDDPAAGAAAATTAGAAFYNYVYIPGYTTFALMRTYVGASPTGNIDMGIYDTTGTNGAPGNRLAHTGAIAASANIFTQNLTSPVLLAPGPYWLALLDTVADNILMRSGNSGGVVVVRSTATNLTVLPAVAGAVSDNLNRLFIMAIKQNSWS